MANIARVGGVDGELENAQPSKFSEAAGDYTCQRRGVSLTVSYIHTNHDHALIVSKQAG